MNRREALAALCGLPALGAAKIEARVEEPIHAGDVVVTVDASGAAFHDVDRLGELVARAVLGGKR